MARPHSKAKQDLTSHTLFQPTPNSSPATPDTEQQADLNQHIADLAAAEHALQRAHDAISNQLHAARAAHFNARMRTPEGRRQGILICGLCFSFSLFMWVFVRLLLYLYRL